MFLILLVMYCMTIMNCFCDMVTDERRIVLFPAGTIVRDSYHRKSVAHHEQDLNQHRT